MAVSHQLAYLSREQVRRVDRLSTQRFALPGILLMENAARAVADLAARMLKDVPRPVLILCGGGNNGGDGLAAARHLANRGYAIDIALTVDPLRYDGDARVNWQIIQAMALPVRPAKPGRLFGRARPPLIIDAIFGTGLAQAPREPFAALAQDVNASHIPVLAVDVPSGLDCDTGEPLGACIRATQTLTFVAIKQGFASPASRAWTGEVTIGDIGCPRAAIDLARRAQA